MNIVIRELKANRKSLLLWCLGVSFMTATGMGKYAGMAGTGETINDLMGNMPKSLQAIMGTSGFDMSTALGYYGLLYLYLAVMASIHAVMLGSNIIAKEVRDKTAEFLLAKPVSRFKIITSKLAASLINLLVLNLVTSFASYSLLQRYGKGEEVAGSLVLLMLGMLFLQFIFLVAGTSAAAVLRKAKMAGTISTGMLFITFVLSVLINFNESMDALRYLTPFKYFEAKQIITNGQIDEIFVIISLFLISALTAVTYHYYHKKDLNI